MTRYFVSAAFILVAFLIIGIGFVVDPNASLGDVLLNLGSEVFGIVITVAVVEAIFEANRNKLGASRFSLVLLTQIDKFVYSWLGGDPKFDPEELETLLTRASENSVSLKKLHRRLDHLGEVAATMLRVGNDIYAKNLNLKRGMEVLATFEHFSRKYDKEMDDVSDENSETAIMVANRLKEAVSYLRKANGNV